MFDCLDNLVTFVGYYALACYLYEHLRTPFRLLWIRLSSDDKSRPSLKERYGEWAAITGSSDGIGKAYAKELARQGLNVALIARNEQKLKAVADEIESEYKVKTKIIIADFTQGAQIYEHIEKELEQLPISILVNNVGMAAETPGPLIRSSSVHVQNLIDTNVTAVSQLSRYFLHRMKETKTKGAIVNVSSGTELQPVPNAALYAASKAYTRSLTLALKYEAEPYGVHVQLLSPDFVVTKINNYSKKIMSGGLFIPSAEVYARSAVAQLRDGVDETPGYLWHHVQNVAMTLLPIRPRLAIIQFFFKHIVDKKRKSNK